MRNFIHFSVQQFKNRVEIPSDVSVVSSPALVLKIGVRFLKNSPNPPFQSTPLELCPHVGTLNTRMEKNFGVPLPPVGEKVGVKNFFPTPSETLNQIPKFSNTLAGRGYRSWIFGDSSPQNFLEISSTPYWANGWVTGANPLTTESIYFCWTLLHNHM